MSATPPGEPASVKQARGRKEPRCKGSATPQPCRRTRCCLLHTDCLHGGETCKTDICFTCRQLLYTARAAGLPSSSDTCLGATFRLLHSQPTCCRARAGLFAVCICKLLHSQNWPSAADNQAVQQLQAQLAGLSAGRGNFPGHWRRFFANWRCLSDCCSLCELHSADILACQYHAAGSARLCTVDRLPAASSQLLFNQAVTHVYASVDIQRLSADL